MGSSKKDPVDEQIGDIRDTLHYVRDDLEYRREKIEEGLNKTKDLLDASSGPEWEHRKEEFDHFVEKGLTNVTGDESFKTYRIDREGNLIRRALHCIASLTIIYYFFPDTFLGIPKEIPIVLILAVLPISLDTIRIVGGYNWKGIRAHEKHKYASYVWFMLGSLILILIAPQFIAAPAIIAAAFGDPLIGETRRFRRSLAFGIGFLFCFLVYFPFLYLNNTNSIALIIFLAIVGAVVSFVAEATDIRMSWSLRKDMFYSRTRKEESPLRRFSKIRYHSDDDMLMQVIPGLFLYIIYSLRPHWFPHTDLIVPFEPLDIIAHVPW